MWPTDRARNASRSVGLVSGRVLESCRSSTPEDDYLAARNWLTWGRPPQRGGSASEPRLLELGWPVRSKKRPASRVTRFLALRLCRRNPTPLPCVSPDFSLTLSARCRLDVQQVSVCVWSPSRRPALPSNGLLRRASPLRSPFEGAYWSLIQLSPSI